MANKLELDIENLKKEITELQSKITSANTEKTELELKLIDYQKKANDEKAEKEKFLKSFFGQLYKIFAKREI